MTKAKTAVIVLASGKGTRMKSARHKVLHPLAGRPMIVHLMETVARLKPERALVVLGPGMEEVAASVKPFKTVLQKQRLGTGHAVKTALTALGGFKGDVLVIYGDSPLLPLAAMKKALDLRRRNGAALALIGFYPKEPGGYGRIIKGKNGKVEKIIEVKDANLKQRQIRLCNSGAMAIDGKRLAELINGIGNDNLKGEYYLTDAVKLARSRGWLVEVAEMTGEGMEVELGGINSQAQLAEAEAALQNRLREKAMAGGAFLADPKSVYFSHDARLGRGVTIGPGVFFGPGVFIGNNVEIRAYCHIEGASIMDEAIIGPFARLRPGAKIGKGAHVGNFVEIKNAIVKPGAKINHLSYVGDARVGEGANIGAGTITCNYDGFAKNFTDIGAGAFIGSNTALIAPVTIGEGAIIGAGSVIAKDVKKDALAMTRASHQQIDGWARNLRRRKSAKKKAGS